MPGSNLRAHLGAEGAQLDVCRIGDVAWVALLPVQRHLVLLVCIGQHVYCACTVGAGQTVQGA